MLELYIKNGKRVDGTTVDIGIEDGKIVSIDNEIKVESKKTIDLNHQSYVSAGWIDAHTHCYENMELYYDSPDMIGYKSGVSTIIDAGSTGADNIDAFYNLTKNTNTNVFALVNISKTGIIYQHELENLNDVQEDLVAKVLEKHPHFVVGLKARMSKTVVGNNDIEPLKLAKSIQQKNKNIPLMVHIGSSPPTLKDILAVMDKGNILTHCYNGKENGILNDQGEIHDFVWDAYRKGIVFDIGHGTDSFNFEVAEKAKKEELVCQIVSTDIYYRNREDGPVFDFSTLIEKMLYLGYSLNEIIPMVTSYPAKTFHLECKGKLEVGYDADITIFDIHKKEKTLVDSNGNTRIAEQVVSPLYTIIGGKDYRLEVENNELL